MVADGLPEAAASTAGCWLCSLSRRPADVVLIDIRLGEELGFGAARQLAASGQAAPVIMISTHSGADYADLIADSPVTGFLPKTELSAAAIRRIHGTG